MRSRRGIGDLGDESDDAATELMLIFGCHDRDVGRRLDDCTRLKSNEFNTIIDIRLGLTTN